MKVGRGLFIEKTSPLYFRLNSLYFRLNFNLDFLLDLYLGLNLILLDLRLNVNF